MGRGRGGPQRGTVSVKRPRQGASVKDHWLPNVLNLYAMYWQSCIAKLIYLNISCIKTWSGEYDCIQGLWWTRQHDFGTRFPALPSISQSYKNKNMYIIEGSKTKQDKSPGKITPKQLAIDFAFAIFMMSMPKCERCCGRFGSVTISSSSYEYTSTDT